MRSLRWLIKRNCLVFLKDKSAVFFSFMSMFIVLMLMVIFLGDMNVKNVTEIIQQVDGGQNVVVNKDDATHLVQMWTIAGILIVNSVTVTLSVIGVMVHDKEQHRIESYYTAPVSKSLIALGYIISSILIGTLFCFVTLVVSVVYVVYTGGAMLGLMEWLQAILLILLNVCVFSIIMFCISLLTKSENAWSSIGTIIGTLVGFVGAIYLPMGALPKQVANILKCTPVLHGTALMRNVLCGDALETAFAGHSAESANLFREIMGIDITMNDKVVGTGFEYLFIIAFGVVALAGVLVLQHRQKINDR